MLKRIVISLIGFYVFWLFVLPLIMGYAISSISDKISHNSNYEIKLTNPSVKLSVLPTVTFMVGEVSLVSKKDSIKTKIENVNLSIRILPLLSKKFHVNDIGIDKIKLSATLNNELELDKNFFKKFENIYLKIDSVKINEFEALLYQKDVDKPIIYKGENFCYLKRNRYLKLKNNSVLNVDGNISKVTSNLFLPKNNDIRKTIFDVNIENINISPLKTYFKHYLPKDLKALNGIVDIKANKEGLLIDLTNCSILMNDIAKSIVFPKKMFVKAKFGITKNYINFESMNVKSDNIDISMNGNVSDYLSKSKTNFNLSVQINKSKVDELINILPAISLEEINFYKLKKYKFYGNILANFSIKGHFPTPNLNGNIYVSDGVLEKPISNNTNGATIKINLENKQAMFDVVVPTSKLEKVWVKGTQELYNAKYADFTVKSTESVDLSVAQRVLNPLHEILNFVIGPLPIMYLDGKGNIDIIVKGNRKNSHIWGIFNIIGANSYFYVCPNAMVTNLDGLIKFQDQNIIFTSKRALFEGKDVFINGVATLLGKFDFKILLKEQDINVFYNIINSSKFLADIRKIIPNIDLIKGLSDLNLKIYGDVKNLDEIKFNENVFFKGDLNLKENKLIVDGIEVEKLTGSILFDNLFFDTNLKAFVGGLPLNLIAKIKNDFANVNVNIPRFNPNCLISNIETRNKLYLPEISVKADYNGSIKKMEYENLNLKAIVLDSKSSRKINYEQNGIINVVNNNIEIKNLKGYISDKQNLFDIDFLVSDAFTKPNIDADIKLKTSDISIFNEILNSEIVPDKFRKYVDDIELNNGSLNLRVKIANNKVYSSTDLSGITFIYKPLGMPIEIINGDILARNNFLRLNKINFLADGMPILADGDIKDIFNKKNFNIYFNSKPKQEFIDKYINKNQIYPIKIKGDIVYWLKIKGTLNDYDLKAQIDMSKNSSFYHLGATVGDIENAIVVAIDSRVLNRNNHKIREFIYDKKIDSLSGRQTRLNMLKAWGDVEVYEDDLKFNNLHIKTTNPTDARIFNIIFRKPNIKQGQFTSDLKLNGKLSDAKILGDFHIFETNIPFLDTTMKNIELIFKDKNIEFNSKGEVMGNDIVFEGILKNSLTLPYKIEKAYLYTKNLNLNQIVDSLKISEVDNISTFESLKGFDLASITAKNFKLKADTIQLRNIYATDFEALTSISENGLFNVHNFNFNIAQGSLSGRYLYNFKNNDMGINIRAENIDANNLSNALFDLKEQIYGDLIGDINLSCVGSDFNSCMKTLNGNVLFNVKDGRMPKLGSLEYLLKAGNLVKGGLTGLSINSVIDLISPLKTGYFTDIYGSTSIKDGIANNIEISTKGKDLNLFVTGNYNFSTSVAEMEVLGLLSRKISNILGPIGNISINTLFNVIPGVDLSKDSVVLQRINKIPGIELSSKTYRKFIAEIKGNINKDDYVSSFKWIN